MTPGSTLVNPLHDTDLMASLNSMELYLAQRNADGDITDFRMIMLNTAAQEMWGKPESELIGWPISQLMSGKDGQFLISQYRIVLTYERTVQFEMDARLQRTEAGLTGIFCVSKLNDDVVMVINAVTEYKQDARIAEQNLLQQAELYKTILDTALTSISVLEAVRDQDGKGKIVDFRYTQVNHERLRMAGQPEAYFIGKKLTELFPGMVESGVFDHWKQVVETQKSHQFEVHYTYDGFDDWSLCLGSPFGDGVVVSYTDITEQKRAEFHARQQSQILQQVIDNTQVGLVLARPVYDAQSQITDFRYVLTNEYNARITGRSVAEMTGALVGDLFPGWQDSDLFRQYVDVVESGQAQRLTFPYEAYGMKGWFDGSFSCVDGWLLYTYTDVTPLKEAELEQQKYAGLLEQVMNMTPASIVLSESVRNAAGEIIDFRMMKLNQMAANYLQNPIDKIQYRRISNYLPGSVDTDLFDRCKQIVQTGEPARIEVPWGDHWYDFSVARFGDGVVIAAQDVTAMYEYRQKLEVANLELKRSNENLQSFAFVSSHDLQEPLRKIISFTNILQTQYDGQFNGDISDIIQRINTAADRMRLLIKDLLAYSKLETRQDLFKPVNISQLIRELQEHELWVALNQSKGLIRLQELPTVTADPLQMHQLFQNLLSNAVKFCPEGVNPSITVSGRVVDRADVPTRLLYARESAGNKSTANWFYEIAVTDNGIGFEEKYIDRIFQVFQRLHGRSQYAGSGIGLAICYKIVERHGGAITASSKPGEGSTFRVYLPV